MKTCLLIINAANGILNDTIANAEIEYNYQGTAELKKGDLIAGYVGQPVGQIRMLFEAVRDSNKNKLYLKKILDIYSGVQAEDFEEVSDLIDSAEASLEDIIEIKEDLYKEIRRRLVKNIVEDNKDEQEGFREQFEQYILNVLELSSTRQVGELGKWSHKLVTSGILDKDVYSISDVDEYKVAANKIRESEVYINYKKERKEKNPSSGLQLDQGMTNYEKFLIHLMKDDNENDVIINPHTGYESDFPRNRIIFGAPGTGKSFSMNQDRETLIGKDNSTDYERVTFHPDYSYANFVGTYKPVPGKDKNGDDTITYEYVPGPFIRVLVKALKSAGKKEKKPFLLMIEEINRADVAAVFGDVFQLLDRGEDYVSEYPVQASEDIKNYLSKPEILGGKPENYEQLRIPDNMFIWATMNSADQGVFPMDTAFKRRWDFKYIGINDNDTRLIGKKVLLGQGSYQHRVEWNELRKKINDFMAGLGINEDKQLGPYFIRKAIVVPESGEEINSEKFCEAFKNKVIMYLFEDAVRQKRKLLFDGIQGDKTRYSGICREFDRTGVLIFHKDITDKLTLEEISASDGENT